MLDDNPGDTLLARIAKYAVVVRNGAIRIVGIGPIPRFDPTVRKAEISEFIKNVLSKLAALDVRFIVLPAAVVGIPNFGTARSSGCRVDMKADEDVRSIGDRIVNSIIKAFHRSVRVPNHDDLDPWISFQRGFAVESNFEIEVFFLKPVCAGAGVISAMTGIERNDKLSIGC